MEELFLLLSGKVIEKTITTIMIKIKTYIHFKFFNFPKEEGIGPLNLLLERNLEKKEINLEYDTTEIKAQNLENFPKLRGWDQSAH